jgi:hypothetical protein
MASRLRWWVCAAAVALATPAWGIDLSLVGAWSEPIGASDLVSGAGSDLADAYESTVDEVVITIATTTGAGDNWRVDVRKSDTNWPSSFKLWVQRTSDGTGPGSITGGTTYQQVTGSDASFFSGAGDRSNVDVRVKLTGASVSELPDTYVASLIYTVVDTP